MSETNNHPNRSPTPEQLARQAIQREARRDALLATAQVSAGTGIAPGQLATNAQILADWIVKGHLK